MQHCSTRGRIGDDQELTEVKDAKREKNTHPDDPDGHDPLHGALALYHRLLAGLATTGYGGRGHLQNLVGVVDVEEQVAETEDWDNGAHLVGLTTVVSPRKVPLYACGTRAERAGREYQGGGS